MMDDDQHDLETAPEAVRRGVENAIGHAEQIIEHLGGVMAGTMTMARPDSQEEALAQLATLSDAVIVLLGAMMNPGHEQSRAVIVLTRTFLAAAATSAKIDPSRPVS